MASLLDNLVEAVIELVANSGEFQTQTGSANPTEAKAHIYPSVVPAGSDAPCCWIPDPEDVRYTRIATGVSVASGSVRVAFIDAIDPQLIDNAGDITDWPALAKTLRQWVGQVAVDMQALAEATGFISARDISLDGQAWYESQKRRRFHKKETASAHCGQDVVVTVGPESGG